mmetsp:Transcript_40575/g.84951  ORF Transcript_40575/g.84951 Transcript_40575/m.84951 type:complete len:483 (-) Transcript_40575:88-1536(-)
MRWTAAESGAAPAPAARPPRPGSRFAGNHRQNHRREHRHGSNSRTISSETPTRSRRPRKPPRRGRIPSWKRCSRAHRSFSSPRPGRPRPRQRPCRRPGWRHRPSARPTPGGAFVRHHHSHRCFLRHRHRRSFPRWRRCRNRKKAAKGAVPRAPRSGSTRGGSGPGRERRNASGISFGPPCRCRGSQAGRNSSRRARPGDPSVFLLRLPRSARRGPRLAGKKVPRNAGPVVPRRLPRGDPASGHRPSVPGGGCSRERRTAAAPFLPRWICWAGIPSGDGSTAAAPPGACRCVATIPTIPTHPARRSGPRARGPCPGSPKIPRHRREAPAVPPRRAPPPAARPTDRPQTAAACARSRPAPGPRPEPSSCRQSKRAEARPGGWSPRNRRPRSGPVSRAPPGWRARRGPLASPGAMPSNPLRRARFFVRRPSFSGGGFPGRWPAAAEIPVLWHRLPLGRFLDRWGRRCCLGRRCSSGWVGGPPGFL